MFFLARQIQKTSELPVRNHQQNLMNNNFLMLFHNIQMVMQTQIQFEDIFNLSFQLDPLKNNIDYELDLILGISPLPAQMQEDNSEDQIGQEKIVRKNSIKSQSQQTNLNQCHEDTSMAQKQSLQACKVSNHHNFQKHTVTALRDLVNQEQIQRLSEDIQVLKYTTLLWKQFLKIKGKSIMTKKFLSILFRSDIQSVALLKPYGFKQMFSQLKQGQILQAKNELRRIVILLFNDKNITSHLQKRQLKRKQEFRLYLINFRRQLENANIKKRISKQSSDWIVDNAKIFDCLN